MPVYDDVVSKKMGRQHVSTTASAAAAIEGLIITAATLTVVSEKRWDDPLLTSAQVFATIVVFWLAHVFAHGVAVRATTASPAAGVLHDMRESWPMVAASLPQLAPMLLVGRYGISYDTALWLSFGIAVAGVAIWGLRLSYVRAGTALQSVGFVAASVALALVLLSLKQIVH